MGSTFRFPAPLALTALLLVAACDSDPADPPAISPEAQAYLEEVIGVMQANSVHRFTIDWASFRAEVFDLAGPAQTIVDTYPAITRALRLLGDDRSTYRTSGGVVLSGADIQCAALIPGDPDLPPGIGYVRVPRQVDGVDHATYASTVQEMMAAADDPDLAGWIVDLRGNSDGNLWTMLAAVGPVLGEDVVGYFVAPQGPALPWEYRDGAAWLDGTEMYRVADPYQLHRDRPRVAVLMDNRTMRSGEGVAIAFRERPDTRSFGLDTCGLTTGTLPFNLSDGAVLDLAVAVMADRTGTVYGSFVAPDQLATGVVLPVDMAVEWLESGD